MLSKRKLEQLQLPSSKVFNELPTYILLKMGHAVCNCDFIIQFYYNKRHKIFYKKRNLLEKSIRKTWEIGAFNHRERILKILNDYKNKI